MIRVGLVGCGTIGSRLALTIAKRYRKQAKLVAVYDTKPDAAAALQKKSLLVPHSRPFLISSVPAISSLRPLPRKRPVRWLRKLSGKDGASLC